MGVELLRRRQTGLGERKKKNAGRLGLEGGLCQHSLKRVGGEHWQEPRRSEPESLRRRLGREYSSYGRVASYPTTRYTVHASRDAPLAFSVYDAYVRRPRCVRVWERMPLPVLGSDDICSVTTDVGISRMFFPSWCLSCPVRRRDSLA